MGERNIRAHGRIIILTIMFRGQPQKQPSRLGNIRIFDTQTVPSLFEKIGPFFPPLTPLVCHKLFGGRCGQPHLYNKKSAGNRQVVQKCDNRCQDKLMLGGQE